MFFICIFIGFFHFFLMSHAIQMLLSKREFFAGFYRSCTLSYTITITAIIPQNKQFYLIFLLSIHIQTLQCKKTNWIIVKDLYKKELYLCIYVATQDSLRVNIAPKNSRRMLETLTVFFSLCSVLGFPHSSPVLYTYLNAALPHEFISK